MRRRRIGPLEPIAVTLFRSDSDNAGRLPLRTIHPAYQEALKALGDGVEREIRIVEALS